MFTENLKKKYREEFDDEYGFNYEIAKVGDKDKKTIAVHRGVNHQVGIEDILSHQDHLIDEVVKATLEWAAGEITDSTFTDFNKGYYKKRQEILNRLKEL